MTEPLINKYPGIKAVSLEVAYDIGAINHPRTEEDWFKSMDQIIGASDVDVDDLSTLDRWCQTLTKKQKELLACGELKEMKELDDECLTPEMVGLFADMLEV